MLVLKLYHAMAAISTCLSIATILSTLIIDVTTVIVPKCMLNNAGSSVFLEQKCKMEAKEKGTQMLSPCKEPRFK